MNLVERIFTHATNNGFQGTQDQITDNYSDALNENDPLLTAKYVHDYISANGYTLDYLTFDDKYFSKWVGSRPKGR